MATTHLHTIESFEQLADVDRVELIHGELREMAPPSEDHNDVVREVVWRIENYIRPRGYEKLFIETSFTINSSPASVLIPDIAFLSENRLDPERDTSKLVGVPPELAIEVISPSERPGKIQEKVQLYLDGGVRVVLLIDPRRRVATIIRPDQVELEIGPEATVDLSDIIPGFDMPLSAIFA